MIEDLSEPMHAKLEARRGSFADRANHIALMCVSKLVAERRTVHPLFSQPIWLLLISLNTL